MIFTLFTDTMTGYVYIITNRPWGVLYVWVTSDLVGRVYKHKNKVYRNSFSDKYQLEKLVYLVELENIVDANSAEKALKKKLRWKKIALIEKENEEWKDLADGWYG